MPIELTGQQWQSVYDALARVRGQDGFTDEEFLSACDWAVDVITAYAALAGVLSGRLGLDVIDGVAAAVLVA